MRVLLVRHAMCDSVGHVLSGRAPGVHLNAAGVAQARAVAARLKEERISAVHASPMERTMETGRLVADASSVPLVVDTRLTELDFGEWTGRTVASLQGEEQWQQFNEHRSHTAPPAGEVAATAQERAVAAIRGIAGTAGTAEGFPVVAVTHGDIIRYVICYVLGMPLDHFHRLEISPASISSIELYESGGRLLSMNDIGHLRDT